MTARDQLREHQGSSSRNGTSAAPTGYAVTFDHKGALLLPEIPRREDIAGLCAWLTCSFNLSETNPITGGRREGHAGPEGHVVLTRAGAPSIRFEPASRINSAPRLIETLSWTMVATDGAVHALKADHCRQIAHVVRMLCSATEIMTAEQEAAGIVGTMMHEAVLVEGFTSYGTTGQRYEAVVALRREIDEATGRPTGPRHYLVDEATGEFVVAVSDLQDAARRHTGSSVPHGWLDARMQALGWARVELQGYGQPGRTGRHGPHARINAYRGVLQPPAEDQDTVNT